MSYTPRKASSTTRVDGRTYDTSAYRRGWTASTRDTGMGETSALERADARQEPMEWYDGHSDETQGNPRYHYRDCQTCLVSNGEDCEALG